MTFFVAATAAAQTSSTAPAKPDQKNGPIFSVTHDGTLQGDGTTPSPLAIADSPTVKGSLTVNGDIQADHIASRSLSVGEVLLVGNPPNPPVPTPNGIATRGGDSTTTLAGDGLFGTGGTGFGLFEGGDGVLGVGGDSPQNVGGTGLVGQGGQGGGGSGSGVLGLGGHPGGFGVVGVGASGDTRAGNGMSAFGGGVANGTGAAGLNAEGGVGDGVGNSGGTGIIATGGLGENGATRGLAARFEGDVVITGKLEKGSGSFKIDHPLDPANKYLSHSFVESPDMMNIYNGNVTTDANGEALVQLPAYFGSLNRDFRYQLTTIGTFAQSIVAEKVTDNHFRIKTSAPNVEVSWQVTGIRQDAYANMNRVPVEEAKPDRERGLYLHPEAFGQPEDKDVAAIHKGQAPADVRVVTNGKAR